MDPAHDVRQTAFPDRALDNGRGDHSMSEIDSSRAAGLDQLCNPTITNPRTAVNSGPSAECLASIANLPGIVVYQRIVTPDEKIRYTYISESCRDLFGASAKEIIANPDALTDRHSPEYKAKFRERLLAASKSLTIWDVEATIVSKDGQKKYTHAIARPEKLSDGSVLWTGMSPG